MSDAWGPDGGGICNEFVSDVDPFGLSTSTYTCGLFEFTRDA